MDKIVQPSQVYARALYVLGRGCPLWIPEPNSELPREYFEGGVRIGDVGVVRSDGGFGFIFNACCPVGDPINRNGVPKGFQPLVWNSNCYRTPGIFPPGDPIVSGGAEVRELDVEGVVSLPGIPVGGGVGLSIKFGQNRGAIIIPHDGVTSLDCESRRPFRDYAEKHATGWYEFIRETLGMEIENGSIYFITDFDKTVCWENAIFSSNAKERSCELIVTTGDLGGGDGRIKLSNSSMHASFSRRRSPPNNQYHNQGLFIRGFRISVPHRFKAFFQGSTAEVTSTYEASYKDALGKKGSSFATNRRFASSSGPESSANSKSVGESSSRGSGSDDMQEELSDMSRGSTSSDTSLEQDDIIPVSEIYHPLKVINDYILQSTSGVRVVITHDQDWIKLLNNEDLDMPDDKALIQRLQTLYRISVNEGCASLDHVEDPSLPSQKPSIPRQPNTSQQSRTSQQPHSQKPDASEQRFTFSGGGGGGGGGSGRYTSYRNGLNNYAQATGANVEYQVSATGPQHAPVWTSRVFVNGAYCGTGEGRTMSASREGAAHQALNYLSQLER
ncbi:hypothetical protein L218DRAFT_1003071 [Marasmius fiardii PR-910]|nr:hypothetical protein L218DRAFT_1003071 [Marasmius fiardii PR-910]